MAWTRRDFVKVAGAGFIAGLTPRSAEALNTAEMVFASAGKLMNGVFATALISERGRVIAHLPLPDRGHDVTQCTKTGRLVVFARRPGTFAIVFDANAYVLSTITSTSRRHFYGHGLFSRDGKLLFATEHAFDTAEGKIGIYDATNQFKRVGEFASYGMDPHDIALSRDGCILCVANGGVETHPDFGRSELNIATMSPSLVFIDTETGDLLARHEPPASLHQLSLRHLGVGDNGRVWVGGQYKGAKSNAVPLIASAALDQPLQFLDVPEQALRHLSFYVGGVAASANGNEIVATSPIGNTALRLDIVSGDFTMLGAKNICGVDWAGTDFAYATGDGVLHAPDRNPTDTGFLFDNHLHRLS